MSILRTKWNKLALVLQEKIRHLATAKVKQSIIIATHLEHSPLYRGVFNFRHPNIKKRKEELYATKSSLRNATMLSIWTWNFLLAVVYIVTTSTLRHRHLRDKPKGGVESKIYSREVSRSNKLNGISAKKLRLTLKLHYDWYMNSDYCRLVFLSSLL